MIGRPWRWEAHGKGMSQVQTVKPAEAAAAPRASDAFALKLTSSDISKLMCLSERTVEDHRSNIRKKLGLGRGDDVHEVLSAL